MPLRQRGTALSHFIFLVSLWIQFLLCLPSISFRLAGGLMGHSGGLAATLIAPHSRGFASHISCWPLFFPPFPGLAPWWSRDPSLLVATEGAFPVSLLPSLAPSCSPPGHFLACLMVTTSTCFRSPPAPPQASRSPPSLTPLNPPCYRRSTPRSRCRSPQGRPSCSNSPYLRHCLPEILGPVSCAPFLLSSSPARSSSSSLSLPRRAAVLLLPRSILLLCIFSPFLILGPCSHSPRPLRPFPWPRPPILP